MSDFLIELEEAEKQLAQAEEAYKAVRQAQSYSIGGRSFTRADMDKIVKDYLYWRKIVNRLRSGGIRVFYGVPE